MSDGITDIVDEVPNTPDPAQNFHESLVGEGKKYASDEELARGYTNADLHLRELRDDLETERKDKSMLKEVLDELRKSPAQNNGVQDAQDNNASATTPQTDDVKQIVREAITEDEMIRKATANRQESLDKIVEAYGSKEQAAVAVRTYIGRDTAKKELLDNIGNTDPDSFFKLVTGTVPPTTPNEPNTPGIKDAGSPSVVLKGGDQLTWAKCKEIKKSDPPLYKSLEFRHKMEQAVAAAQAAGQDFFNM